MSVREFNAEEFHSTVYDLVRLIPEGRVTTYGTCPKCLATRLTVQDILPRYVAARSAALTAARWLAKLYVRMAPPALTADSRSVGAALKFLQDDTVPWHRVIGSGGIISERGDGGAGAARQAERLRAEGVEVVDTMSHSGAGAPLAGRGRYRVASLRSGGAGPGWFPASV